MSSLYQLPPLSKFGPAPTTSAVDLLKQGIVAHLNRQPSLPTEYEMTYFPSDATLDVIEEWLRANQYRGVIRQRCKEGDGPKHETYMCFVLKITRA